MSGAPTRTPPRRGVTAPSGRARLLLAGLLLTQGCYSYVRPGDTTALPAWGWVPTQGGQRLDVDDAGALVSDYAPADIEAALGVTLTPGDGGVLVAAARSSTDGAIVALEPGDVIVEARPLAPWLPTELSVPDAAGVPVRDLEDLRGLAVGVEGLELELRVRRGDEHVVVRQPLREAALVAARPWAPALADALGVELARLDDWPASRLPEGAGPEDYLVVRVGAGSPGARAGLRPLDVIDNERGLFDLHMRNIPPELAPIADALLAQIAQDPELQLVTVRAADGRAKRLELRPPRAPRDSGLLLLWSYQADHARSHLGLLPFDLLLHRSSDAQYDALADDFSVATRWSFLVLFQTQSASGGAQEGLSAQVNPLVDQSRGNYLFERLMPE